MDGEILVLIAFVIGLYGLWRYHQEPIESSKPPSLVSDEGIRLVKELKIEIAAVEETESAGRKALEDATLALNLKQKALEQEMALVQEHLARLSKSMASPHLQHIEITFPKGQGAMPVQIIQPPPLKPKPPAEMVKKVKKQIEELSK